MSKPNYSAMSNDQSADALAQHEGHQQARGDAREWCCNDYADTMLKEYSKRPAGDASDGTMSLWSLFAERQCEHGDPLDKPLSRMLISIATMSDDAISSLRTSSSDVADAALLIRDDIRDLFLEQAAGEFDAKYPE